MSARSQTSRPCILRVCRRVVTIIGAEFSNSSHTDRVCVTVCVQGVSDDILNAKDTLYQHLTCSRTTALSQFVAFITICVQGASDDILNAKNTLYQHLTWDPEKAVSMCSKLALPLATPAIGVTPPVSPKSTTADGEGLLRWVGLDSVISGPCCTVCFCQPGFCSCSTLMAS